MWNFIQNIRDLFYFVFNENQKDFLDKIHLKLDPFWNVINSMPEAYECGTVNIFNFNYDISVYKKDLFLNFDSGMSIRVKRIENTYEFIDFEFHGTSTHIWYFLDNIPIVEEIRNRKGLEKYFKWSEKHLDEFYKKMKYLAINWI